MPPKDKRAGEIEHTVEKPDGPIVDKGGKASGHDVDVQDQAHPSRSELIAKDLPQQEDVLRTAGVMDDTERTDWRFDQVIMPIGRDGSLEPGPDTAAVDAAVNAGYRPTGKARLEGPVDHPDGVSKVFTWVVPVLRIKPAPRLPGAFGRAE